MSSTVQRFNFALRVETDKMQSFTVPEVLNQMKKGFMQINEYFSGPVVPYFDFDYRFEDKKLFDDAVITERKNLRDVFKSLFPDAKIYFMDACGPSQCGFPCYKLSFHVIIRGIGYFTCGSHVFNAFCEKINEAFAMRKSILKCDRQIYHEADKLQKFRVLEAVKKDDPDRPLRLLKDDGEKLYLEPRDGLFDDENAIEQIREDDFAACLVQNIANEKLTEIPYIKKEKQPKKQEDLNSNCCADESEYYYDLVDYIINNISKKRATEYGDWLRGCFAIGSIEQLSFNDKKTLVTAFAQLSTKNYNIDVELSIDKMERSNGDVTIATLLDWLREDNIEAFNKRPMPPVKENIDDVDLEIDDIIANDDEGEIDYYDGYVILDAEDGKQSNKSNETGEDKRKNIDLAALLLNGEEGFAQLFAKCKKNDIKITDAEGNGYLFNKKLQLWQQVEKIQIQNEIYKTLCPFLQDLAELLAEEAEDDVEGNTNTKHQAHKRNIAELNALNKTLAELKEMKEAEIKEVEQIDNGEAPIKPDCKISPCQNLQDEDNPIFTDKERETRKKANQKEKDKHEKAEKLRIEREMKEYKKQLEKYNKKLEKLTIKYNKEINEINEKYDKKEEKITRKIDALEKKIIHFRESLVTMVKQQLEKTNTAKNVMAKLIDVNKLRDDEFKKLLNKQLHLLPVKGAKLSNGEILEPAVIDLKTGEARKRVRLDYFTHEVNIIYDPSINLNNLMAEVINPTFCEDTELINDVKKICGLFLSGDHARKFYIFHGRGKNGKSTLKTLITNCCGKFASDANKYIFIKGRDNSANSHTSHLTRLQNLRVAFVDEIDPEDKLNMEMAKKIGASGALVIRKLNEDEKDPVNLQVKGVLCVNDIPNLEGADLAIFDRLVAIPFNARFVESPRLKNEYKISDINKRIENGYLVQEFLTWAVQGAINGYATNWSITSAQILEKTKHVHECDDLLKSFLDDHTETSDVDETKFYTPTTEIIEQYKLYLKYIRCIESPPHSTIIGKQLAKKGFQTIRTGKSSTRNIKNIKLLKLIREIGHNKYEIVDNNVDGLTETLIS